MKTYDYIFAGGGAAGLSLAYLLANQPGNQKKILIIDRDQKNRNDRTWCFWSDQPSPYPQATFRAWNQITFQSEQFSKTYHLAPYHYYMIRGLDFYNFINQNLALSPRVHFHLGEIQQILDGEETASVVTGNQIFTARWVFDSRFIPEQFRKQPERFHYLNQHFRGWEIETDSDCFDPQTPVMLDFRTPQNQKMRFIYILPFDTRRALIEYTLFSEDLLTDAEYDLGLTDYIHNILGLDRYRIHSVENGVIPMTDHPFGRKLGKRILAIGTRGGLVKPSTGYAFWRIQQDSQAIIRSLDKYGHPFHLQNSPARYRFFDTIMLQVMKKNGGQMKDIFTDMFRNNPIQRIFGFLYETAGWLEDLRILGSVPAQPFIRALLRVKLLGKI